MDVVGDLHMNGGETKTSYADNSIVQKVVIDRVSHLLEETAKKLYFKFGGDFGSCIRLADLGCSSGPNTLSVVSKIIITIHGLSLAIDRPEPEIQNFLNDLPCNDFNTIFKSIPAFHNELKSEKGDTSSQCFISGMPGFFYGRLFPSGSLHLIHSSYSVHWLSEVPKGLEQNKGNIFVADTSPKTVFTAYREQSRRDFTMFLSLRAEEVVPGGHMVLTLLGRCKTDPCGNKIWGLLAQSFVDLATQGFIEGSDVDTFNLPYYNPCTEETKAIVQTEGSFNLDKLRTFELSWDPCNGDDIVVSGRNVAKSIRAVAEPMLASHFGGAIIDILFINYARRVTEHLALENTKHFNVAILLTRK